MYAFNPRFICISVRITDVLCSALPLCYYKHMLRRLSPIRFALH